MRKIKCSQGYTPLPYLHLNMGPKEALQNWTSILSHQTRINADFFNAFEKSTPALLSWKLFSHIRALGVFYVTSDSLRMRQRQWHKGL